MDYETRLRELYAGFHSADMPLILSRLSDTVEFVSDGPESLPWSGTHHGHRGAQVFFKALGDQLGEFDEYALLQIAVDGNTAFVRGRSAGSIRSTGKSYVSCWVHYYVFDGEKVSRFQEFYDTASIASAMASGQ